MVKQSFWSIWLDLENEISKSQPEPEESWSFAIRWDALAKPPCCTPAVPTSFGVRVTRRITSPIDRVHEQIVHRTRTFALGSTVLAKTSKVKRT